MAVAAGTWWLLAAIAGGLLVAWLARSNAGALHHRVARGLLQLIQVLDVLMVGLLLAGLYASIVALPQGFG